MRRPHVEKPEYKIAPKKHPVCFFLRFEHFGEKEIIPNW